MNPHAPKPAVFFDRDGTLMEEVHYCKDPSQVRAIAGADSALARLRAAGFLNVVITNQSGIGRGTISMDEYTAVANELARRLDHHIDATYFCPDTPDNAGPRRKPGTGMIEEAVRDLQIDLARSWFVGDKAIDIECGRAAGLRTILVRTGYGAGETDCAPDFIEADVGAAAGRILGSISDQPVSPGPQSTSTK